MTDAILAVPPTTDTRADGASTNWYQAFGLTIRSQVALPELLPGREGTADLEICRVATRSDFPPADAATSYCWGETCQELLWPAVGRFTIAHNRIVQVEAAPGVDDRLLAFPLLGPIMALVKHLQGRLVLHGSGIAVQGQGIAFLGDKLAGKSTLASAFVARGHKLLTDDVIAIAGLADGQPEIEPAFPLVKLSAEAARLLAETPSEAWPTVMPGFPKRVHRLADQAMPTGVAPVALFVLARGGEARIDLLPAPEVFGALMHNSYLKKFIAQTLNRTAGAHHLEQIVALAQSCLVARLQVPDSIDRLGEAVALVERELATRTGAPAGWCKP